MGNDVSLLKDRLARACRMLEMAGLIDFSGHISGRIAGGKTFFIHPMALSRVEVAPEDFIEVTLEGEPLQKGADIPHETSIHAAVYQARPDVNSVIHVHPHYCVLPSVADRNLVPVCQYGSIFGDVVPVYGDSEKITTFEQARQMARGLGSCRAIIMKGHGAVVAESSVEAVFVAALYLERNAELFVRASILGEPIPLREDERQRAASACFGSSTIQKVWTYFMEKGRKARMFWD